MHTTTLVGPERLRLRRAQVGIATGLLSWGAALAAWLIVDFVNGARLSHLLPHVPRLALDLGRWMFPPGCLFGVVALRQVLRSDSLTGVLLQVPGAGAVIGALTGVLYGITIRPMHPKGWALATGIPAGLLVPVGIAVGWYLWRRRISVASLSAAGPP